MPSTSAARATFSARLVALRGMRRVEAQHDTPVVAASAAGKCPCSTFSTPSGVVGTWVASSIFSASSRAVTSSTPDPMASSRLQPARRAASAGAVRAPSLRGDHALRVLGAERAGASAT